MASSDSSPTKMELANVRQKLALAHRGHDMLKRKRDSLIREHADANRELKAVGSDFSMSLSDCYAKARLVELKMGSLAFLNASREGGRKVKVDVSKKKKAGVEVVFADAYFSGERTSGYSMMLAPVELDSYLSDFERLTLKVVRIAALEKRMAVLGAEIRRTRRKVNALEKVKIAGLDVKRAYISEYLEEAEREDYARLKHIKERMKQEEDS